jgi:hypothetical protein
VPPCEVGRVTRVSPDAAELPDTRERDRKDIREHVMPPSGFRTLGALDSPNLEADGMHYLPTAGMLVSAEVNLGSRTMMEYLLSPVQKTVHEAGREMSASVMFACGESGQSRMQFGSHGVGTGLVDTKLRLPHSAYSHPLSPLKPGAYGADRT